MTETECAKNKNLLKKKIVTNNYLLRKKDNIKFIEKRKCMQKNRNILVD